GPHHLPLRPQGNDGGAAGRRRKGRQAGRTGSNRQGHLCFALPPPLGRRNGAHLAGRFHWFYRGFYRGPHQRLNPATNRYVQFAQNLLECGSSTYIFGECHGAGAHSGAFSSFPINRQPEEGKPLQVLVRDNNVDQALRVLKKKLQREGVFREMKARRAYEKPSEKRIREKEAAIGRARKEAKKKAQREGLLPKPKRKPLAGHTRSPAHIVNAQTAA